jgi:hypothetical protein
MISVPRQLLVGRIRRRALVRTGHLARTEEKRSKVFWWEPLTEREGFYTFAWIYDIIILK